MAIFKCKMCGGSLEILPDMEVCDCEFCGTAQTLPRLNDEKKVSLYDRANHFRRNNDFDKAMSVYEQILNEDNTDAEAYWSIVLCRYGIEYVEDPSTRERIPTVNRAQYTSIFADEDYKEAINHASEQQKMLFERDAKVIDDIQKGILAISQKEEPFDIFICYKETDCDGKRTQDSVIANDLYHQLVREGFKVFFAAITLEDKLGRAYEPYIFAALNSAKVMIVLGTKPEYFEAPWVKNEWSRYLTIIKNDPSKMLIPAYKNMDPYDLPDEFSFLQAQDMSKIGFMNDIIHGIKKVSEKKEKTEAKSDKSDVLSDGLNSSSGVDALLKRSFFFLEDGNWANANMYCEKVLDNNPECAEAYVAKLMVELKLTNQDELANGRELLEEKDSFKKAKKFADDELRGKLEEYEFKVKESYLKVWYDRCQSATTEQEMLTIIDKLEKIADYSNTEEIIQWCREKANLFHCEQLYGEALAVMDKAVSDLDYAQAANLFNLISGFQDADYLYNECIKQKEICQVNDNTCAICRDKIGVRPFIPKNSALKCCENCFSRLSIVQQNVGKDDAVTKNSYNYLKKNLPIMTRREAIVRVTSILEKYEGSFGDSKSELTEEEIAKRALIEKAEKEKEERENAEKANMLREKKKIETINKNANYEYDIQIVVDIPTGGMDVDMLKYVVQKYAEDGWKLHTVTTSAAGTSVGQTIVIFERMIKEFGE